MNEIQDIKTVQTQNTNQSGLGAHYSTKTKVELPTDTVANGPETIPEVHLFNDFDANARLSAINKDIFESTQKVAKPEKKKKFLGLF